jgi:hypothetical protein
MSSNFAENDELNVAENGATPNDVTGEGAAKKKRNRRKPHSKKGAESVDTENVDKLESNDSMKPNVEVMETVKNAEGEKENGEKAAKKKRNRKKSTKSEEEKAKGSVVNKNDDGAAASQVVVQTNDVHPVEGSLRFFQ